jgi:gluconate 2-dehydrogenase alpha chain
MAHEIADICLVGMGAVGGVLSKQLGTAGLKVVALERGGTIATEDYAPRDSIRFVAWQDRLEWVRHDPTTYRSVPSERATLRYGTTPSNVVGGSLLSWTGQAARFQPGDFKVFSQEIATGVAERAGADLTGYDVVDWPIGYDDLEPYYERFEWEFGVSGHGGRNPFAGPRRRDYPMPPLRRSAKTDLVEAACQKLGYHPYQSGAGVLSQPYRPPAPYDTRIEERPACVYCGHCNRYGCHVNAKSSSLHTFIPVALGTGNVDLRTRCKVFRVNTSDDGRATGVLYFDPEGQIQEQRARLVILAGYMWENSRLLLLSSDEGAGSHHGLANSSGMVGRGIFGHGDVRVYGLFDDYVVNAFIGPQSGGVRIDDFNGNNFDHTGVGFIRGGAMGGGGGGAPVERLDVVPPGMETWGDGYKDYFTRYYTRTLEIGITPETLAHEDNRIDLDPTYRDAWGLPLPRGTFSFHENERRMHRYMGEVGERIMRETGASNVWTRLPGRVATRWSGGTRMGADPRKSVLNGYCQSHDVENLFIVGASVFPTLTGYPATATICALAYRTAEYILTQREWFR